MAIIFRLHGKKALSTQKIIFDDCINGSDPVLPANFFPLSICSAVVRDTDLINPRASLRNLCHDFRFNAESILLNSDAIQEFARSEKLPEVNGFLVYGGSKRGKPESRLCLVIFLIRAATTKDSPRSSVVASR